MLKFIAGLVTGILVAKPANNLIQKHLTPPVREKLKNIVNEMAVRLNDSIDSTESE
jgi:hypothetical protein